ncbi:hypothetical protein [Halomonas sp. BC04]|nr:hypothetical protein [Halomonas sp. BC04]EWH00609.1 hypothetical protein Q427_18495 [Halomonas sp. BC04]
MSEQRRSVIKRVYVPTYFRQLPSGERVQVPGHYREQGMGG